MSRPASRRVSSGCGGKVAGVMRGGEGSQPCLAARVDDAGRSHDRGLVVREPHQVGHRRRVAVLAEGRVRDGVRDRAILLARERSGGPRARFSALTVAGEYSA